jgi:hypothetical protein
MTPTSAVLKQFSMWKWNGNLNVMSSAHENNVCGVLTWTDRNRDCYIVSERNNYPTWPWHEMKIIVLQLSKFNYTEKVFYKLLIAYITTKIL